MALPSLRALMWEPACVFTHFCQSGHQDPSVCFAAKNQASGSAGVLAAVQKQYFPAAGGSESLMVAPLVKAWLQHPLRIDRAQTIGKRSPYRYSRPGAVWYTPAIGANCLYRIGLVSKVVAAISCAKFLLVSVFSAIGLDAAIAYVDMIVLPLLVIQGGPFDGGAHVKTHRSNASSALN